MPGFPLHTAIPSMGRQATLLIVKDILKKILNLSPSIIQGLNIGVIQELEDIKNLIDNEKINDNTFELYGLSLKQAYDKIKKDLQTHNTKVFSHGDLCLPNIIVIFDKKWSLIDFSKCGFGYIYRDLSSLKVSLIRNIDQAAFFEL